MLSLEDLVATYTKVIGAGGFGIVKTGIGDPYENFAVKFLHASKCSSAKKEYIVNKFLYSAYEILTRCNPVSGISIVKPYDYVSSKCIVNCNKDTYDCAVIMERLISPMPDGYAYHLAFNGVISPGQLNKIIYAGDVPRGYFFDPIHTETMFAGQITLEDITYRIGILDGISIFGARMNPIDVEYILTVSEQGLAVTMLDFGMFGDINLTPTNVKEVAEEISTKQEYNLYYHPYSDAIPQDRRESCRFAYIKGFTEAFNCFENDNYRPLYDALIEIYNMEP